MISADTKDWTWVLDRPCPQCGFDASSCLPTSVAGLVRENAHSWEQLRRDGKIRAGRPNESTWSTLEYACHVRDVYRRFSLRIGLMLTEDGPSFENWDQDASAITDRYERQAPEVAAAELISAASVVASMLDQVSSDEWRRVGRRSDGASFTVGTIAQYMIHDAIHHVWDVSNQHP